MRLKVLSNSQAQSITEFVVIMGIVALALIGMQTYMKRGIQSVIKVSTDELGNQQQAAREIYLGKGTLESSNFTTTTDSKRTKKQTKDATTGETSYSIEIDHITTESTGSAVYSKEKD